MRAAKLGTVGLGVLFATRALIGCANDLGEASYDAGSLPDVGVLADDSGSNEDAGAPPASDDGGLDATLGSGDGGGAEDGGEGDTSLPQGADAAGDAGSRDASDGSVRETDASDGAVNAQDASDGAVNAQDASDGGASALDAGDGAANAADASTGVADASDASPSSDDDAGDASPSDIDASDASPDGDDASDAALACTSCGMSVSFLGNTAAFVSGTATSVPLQGGTVPDGATVSIITQTYPEGAVTAGNAHVIYATDSSFTTQLDAPMTFDHQTGNNDQWYVVLPAQPANTTVYWYVRADGCDCSTVLYNDPGGLASYTYTEQ
jgi:hypothetical protein